MATSKSISLKILVDTKTQKVVFAEAGKDLVDFLFNISYLPVGTVMNLLANHDAMGGCLNNIYRSISNTMLLPLRKIDDMLRPIRVTFTASDLQSLPRIQTSTSSTFHVCEFDMDNKLSLRIGMPTATNGILNNCDRRCSNRTGLNCKMGSSLEEEGYVKGALKYMVMDDLSVMPASGLCSISIVNGFDIKNVGILETMEVHLGKDNALKLLKASILFKTVLTDVFLCGKNSKDSK